MGAGGSRYDDDDYDRPRRSMNNAGGAGGALAGAPDLQLSLDRELPMRPYAEPLTLQRMTYTPSAVLHFYYENKRTPGEKLIDRFLGMGRDGRQIFSNLYPSVFRIASNVFKAQRVFVHDEVAAVQFASVENMFQSSKCSVRGDALFVARDLSPLDAASYGQGKLQLDARQHQLLIDYGVPENEFDVVEWRDELQGSFGGPYSATADPYAGTRSAATAGSHAHVAAGSAQPSAAGSAAQPVGAQPQQQQQQQQWPQQQPQQQQPQQQWQQPPPPPQQQQQQQWQDQQQQQWPQQQQQQQPVQQHHGNAAYGQAPQQHYVPGGPHDQQAAMQGQYQAQQAPGWGNQAPQQGYGNPGYGQQPQQQQQQYDAHYQQQQQQQQPQSQQAYGYGNGAAAGASNYQQQQQQQQQQQPPQQAPRQQHGDQGRGASEASQVNKVPCRWVRHAPGNQPGRPPLRPDWETVKVYTMWLGLQRKFQDPDAPLRVELDALVRSGMLLFFVEHTRNDKQWADANDGTGTNMLGKLITQIFIEERLRQGTRFDSLDLDFLKAPNNRFVQYL